MGYVQAREFAQRCHSFSSSLDNLSHLYLDNGEGVNVGDGVISKYLAEAFPKLMGLRAQQKICRRRRFDTTCTRRRYPLIQIVFKRHTPTGVRIFSTARPLPAEVRAQRRGRVDFNPIMHARTEDLYPNLRRCHVVTRRR